MGSCCVCPRFPPWRHRSEASTWDASQSHASKIEPDLAPWDASRSDLRNDWQLQAPRAPIFGTDANYNYPALRFSERLAIAGLARSDFRSQTTIAITPRSDFRNRTTIAITPRSDFRSQTTIAITPRSAFGTQPALLRPCCSEFRSLPASRLARHRVCSVRRVFARRPCRGWVACLATKLGPDDYAQRRSSAPPSLGMLRRALARLGVALRLTRDGRSGGRGVGGSRDLTDTAGPNPNQIVPAFSARI
jgi:hypothetical protein